MKNAVSVDLTTGRNFFAKPAISRTVGSADDNRSIIVDSAFTIELIVCGFVSMRSANVSFASITCARIRSKFALFAARSSEDDDSATASTNSQQMSLVIRIS